MKDRRSAVRPFGVPLRLAVAALVSAAPVAWLHAQQPAVKAQDTQGPAIEEIVVTAERRSEPLSKVPISVSTFSAEQMDDRGVKEFDDIVRLSPGLNLTRNSATGANQISIRGVSSDAGSGTTGVYIDDTPIQVRNLGFGAANAFPGLFDVERVEVLRGPQGTLFGAGSEGGTVRFITTSPSLTEQSSYVRAEGAGMAGGSPTYEFGAAFGSPIIQDVLGFRVSAFIRHEGGYIDDVNGSYRILDPTGAAYGRSIAFTQTSTIESNANWARTAALRAAFKWTPNESLTVTPAIFYQEHHLNDGAADLYDVGLSDPDSDRYARQGYVQFPAGTVYHMPNSTEPLTLNDMSVPRNQFGTDRFVLTSVGVSWDLGPVLLVSNTSYFHRTSKQWYDYTKGYVEFYEPQFFVDPADGVTPLGNYAPLGWKGMALYNNSQGNLVQELRVQSKDTSALTWVAGAFYSHDRQAASEPISTNFMINAPWVGFYPTNYGYGYYGLNGGPPFGAGHTAAQNFFGDNFLPNAVSFYGTWLTVEQQIAGFAQADYKVTDRLKLTAGLRVSHNKLDFEAAYLGPENNSNAPFGFDCPTGPVCPFGSGVLAPAYPTSSTHLSETAVTPKAAVEFQITDSSMVYFTAAKGFRPAGASLRAPTICNQDLITNGYVDSSGNPVQPTSYKSDSLWSYELGSKSRLLGGRLAIDGSIYEIKWKNIQTNVPLPDCAYNFVDNLADATSKGFDLDVELRATEHLDLSVAMGYNKPTFDRDANSPGGNPIYRGGSSIPDAGPPLSVSASVEYGQPFAGDLTGYVRLDYTYTSEWRRFGTDDPGTPNFDPALKPIPAYSVGNLRVGARFGKFDVSAFVHNLADSHPDLELNRAQAYDPQDWWSMTIRPRTYGVTAIWRR